ncbi:MAG TPA: hypothetical protein VGK67_06680 [Myxococcales bacterium]|jgi:hypothetical protein
MPSLSSTLVLALLAASASAPALPAEPTFKSGFAPHPFAAEVKVANGTTTLVSKGYGKCGTAATSDEPAFAFTVEETLTDLRLWVDQPAALVLPDKTFVCITSGSIWLSKWTPGRYQVLLSGTGAELSAKVRLEQPVRAQAEVKTALEKTPEIELSSSIKANPSFQSLTPVAVFPARGSGVGCAPELLAPLARLKVPYPSKWSIVEKSGAPLVLVPATGGCLTSLKDLSLETGDYVLWAAPDAASEQKVWELSIADQGRALTFGEAPIYDLGLLKKPMLLPGRTGDGSWGPVSASVCPNLPRAPSFYLKGADGLKNVEILFWKDGGLGDQARLAVYGPIDTVTAVPPMRCDLSKPTFRELKGTYAVFVSGGEKRSQDFVAIAQRVDVSPDYAALPVMVPDALPVPDRALANFFPFWRDGLDSRRFFAAAPRQLFVATSAGNTPALVVLKRELTLDILKLDGTMETVGASEIKPDVAFPPGLPPNLLPPAPVTTVEEAIAAAGPSEAAFVAQFHAVENAVNACTAKWLTQNDPQWAAGQEIFRLTTAEPKGPRAETGADKVCGAKRIEAAGKLLIKQVNASRKNAKPFLAALKKKFPK